MNQRRYITEEREREREWPCREREQHDAHKHRERGRALGTSSVVAESIGLEFSLNTTALRHVSERGHTSDHCTLFTLRIGGFADEHGKPGGTYS